jgi:hypothetical protein
MRRPRARNAAWSCTARGKKARFLRRSLDLGEGPTWLISMAGANGRARARAGELGLYVSGRADVQAIQAATVIQR